MNVMEDRKEFCEMLSFGFDTAIALMNAQQLWLLAQYLCKSKPSKNSYINGGDGLKTPPLTEVDKPLPLGERNGKIMKCFTYTLDWPIQCVRMEHYYLKLII